MSYINYTPTRSLIGGSDGKLHDNFQRFSARHKDSVVTTTSLDQSNIETTYLGRAKFYLVTTSFIDLSLWPKWEEFWHSVSGGELFTIDAYGFEFAPNNPISVRLVPNTWKESEPGPRHHVYEFQVRVA